MANAQELRVKIGQLGWVRDHIPLIALVALVVLVGLIDTRFFTVSTLLVLVSDTMTLFLMATGVTFVILMGGIDLSIQAVASMTATRFDGSTRGRFSISPPPVMWASALTPPTLNAARQLWT